MAQPSFQPKPLPWSTNSFPDFLSPGSIDAHYQLYLREVDRMNRLAQQYPVLQRLNLAQIVHDYVGEIGTAAAQVLNHEFFWKILAPPAQGGVPSGRLYQLIVDEFGSLEDLIRAFSERASRQVGSGWVWLVYDPSADFLLIDDGDEAYNPITNGYIPLLALDLWEHAYMPDYGLNRQDYIANFWRYINWSYLEQIAHEQIFLNQLRVALNGRT